MLIDDELLAWDGVRWVPFGDFPAMRVPQTINYAARRPPRGPAQGTSAPSWCWHPSRERSSSTAARSASSLPEGHAFSRAQSGRARRRDVIRPDRANFAGDEAYRFRHLLIRDAAYNSLSKARRADLHERLATWLERTAADRLGEYEEIVGYHLEQAYRCRVELGSADDERAAPRPGLATARARRAAGARAQRPARGDRPARARGSLPADDSGGPSCCRSSARR